MSRRPYITSILDLYAGNTGYSLRDVRDVGGMVAVIHKATEGTTQTDSRFLAVMEEARDLEMPHGAYHFARAGDPIAQADRFVARVREAVEPESILLALDLEGSLSLPTTMTTRDAARFVERVRELTGRWPLFYAGASKLRERARRDPNSMQVLGQCPLWLAQYGEEPDREDIPAAFPGDGWALWQYTSGKAGPRDEVAFPRLTAGFKRGKQDRSAFRGTVEELRGWWSTAGR